MLLAKFTSSELMIADNTGKTTSRLADYYRTKTYVKPDDMLHPKYPVFPQPYQLAVDKFGGTWNDFNEVCVVQVANCNLGCWYCYVDPKLRRGQIFEGTPESEGGPVQRLGDWFDPDQVMGMWRESQARILRISGGEPTMAPGFLRDMVYKADSHDCLLWIDTNMSTDDRFFDAMKDINPYFTKNTAFAGCFKGFTADDAAEMCGADLDHQFVFASKLVKETPYEVFFYIPGVFSPGIEPKDIETFFHRLRDQVDEYAPLRTYILQVKNYSPTEADGWAKYQTQFPDEFSRPIDVWQHLIEKHYAPEFAWIPNHQVRFASRREEPLVSHG